jgi:50S ribosomal protein L16 3-hydroxylase
MTDSPLGELDTRRFLQEFWQRKPCLIRQAFPDFDPLLDGDDLAGLACEPTVEARIISGGIANRDWKLQHGPFQEQDFKGLGESNWTLLVQDVEKHYPPLRSLLDRFAFLPTWRIDDLMVSFAAPGGSVGPHVDQYDVFLLQASGRRRWEITETFDPELLPDLPFGVLERFEPSEYWDLEPGDMLYLPPNVAHHGTALDACMTYSIGLRAPSAADLFLALGEWLSNQENQGGRYADPDLESMVRDGEVETRALQDLRKLLADSLVPGPELNRFLGHFLSRFRMAHEPAPPPELMDEQQLLARLKAGDNVCRNPWTRLAWVMDAGRARLFGAGTEWSCTPEFAQRLCAVGTVQIAKGELQESELALVHELINAGHLYLAG